MDMSEAVGTELCADQRRVGTSSLWCRKGDLEGGKNLGALTFCKCMRASLGGVVYKCLLW